MYHKTDKNKVNLFVRDCICTAIFQLMEKKKYEDITVSEIIAKAGVSRMGFYRNYESKESVIEDFILRAFNRTVDEIESKRPLNLQTYNVIVTVLENFKKYSDYINILLSQNLDYLTYTCYQKAFNRIYRQKKVTPLRYYYASILMANMFALEVGWVKSGLKDSPDELARMYSKILTIQSKI